MSINVNRSNFDTAKSLLDKDAVLIYEILTETIDNIEGEYKITLQDELTFSTKNGSLKDEHNGKIYYRALSGLKQLVKHQIINSFIEEDISKDIEHIVRFRII